MAVQVQLMFLFMTLLLGLFNFPFVIVEAQPIAKPGCDDKCRGVKIPYPFGMNYGCYLEEGYKIDCKSTTPKIQINGINLEVINISVAKNIIRVNLPIVFQNCSKSLSSYESNNGIVVDLKGSPFAFSETDNWFVGVGCNYLAMLVDNETYAGGCMSICDGKKGVGTATTFASTTNSICNGINCCQTSIPSNLEVFQASFLPFKSKALQGKGNDKCKYAYLVDQEWFANVFKNSSLEKILNSMRTRDDVPAVLNWTIDSRLYSQIPVINESRYNLSSCDDFTNLTVSDVTNQTVRCSCSDGFQGNPYVSYGCYDINECENADACYGHKDVICENTYGSYNCVKLEHNKSRVKMTVTGIGIGIVLLVLVIGTWWSYKILKRKRKEKLKKKYFKRNGGFLLQEQLSSGEVNVERIKMFSSKELDKATDRYNADRMLGEGGQGTVYKGMLADGKIVAVKKSRVVDESQLRQFINEIVLLSQINHRNVVKLLGCCLETKVPLLVYEFIPNGTLSQFLHDPNEEFPLTWEMRLRIATEVAGALFYLHSAASIPVYHRDIKSTNILLDEKYRAKIADFGTSRSVTIDQTHVTTQVQGTFGYLDPEYFQSSQFTDKSDVYSFGVVLVELLTGQKAISSTRSEQGGRSLATYFIVSMENNCLFDILDPQVMKQGKEEDAMMVAKLAKSCLRLNGKERPTMKEVTMVLEEIQKSLGTPKSPTGLIVPQEIEYDRNEVMGACWDLSTTSTASGLDSLTASSLDRKPLLKA